MKGYEKAFEVCEIVNQDQKVIDNNFLIYPGGWRDDFFTIIIKRFDEYTSDVDDVVDLIRQVVNKDDNWVYIKDFYDDHANFVEIQYQIL